MQVYLELITQSLNACDRLSNWVQFVINTVFPDIKIPIMTTWMWDRRIVIIGIIIPHFAGYVIAYP